MRYLIVLLLSFTLTAQASYIGGSGVSCTGVSDGLVYRASGGQCGFASVAGTGDVVGPASSTDNALARYDGTTGKAIQDGGPTYSDAGLLTVVNQIVSGLTASQAVVTNGSKQLSSLAYTDANTASTLVQRDASKNFSAGTITAALSGNASTSTALASNPTDCSANQYAKSIAANGDLTCETVTVATALASNPTDCSAGTFATAIAANGDLTCTAAVGLIEVFTGHMEAPTAKPFIIDQYAAYAYTVNSIVSQCDSGTADFDLEIDGTDVTGCAAQQMASSEATDTCTAANSVSVGNTLRLNITAVSSPDDCRFTIKVTR